MSTLYTITANLLAEWTVDLPGGIRLGKTQRAIHESFQVGGKGINVSRMAERLGRTSTAVLFPAGYTGALCCAWLEERKFSVLPFRQDGESRTGYVVRTSDSGETTFLGRDRPMQAEIWQQALSQLVTILRPGDGVCLCGSVPGWSPALAEGWRNFVDAVPSSVWIGIDTYGAPLADISGMRCDCIKINHDEWLSLFPDRDLRPETVAAYLSSVPSDRNWVITDGPERIWGRDCMSGKVFHLTPPKVKEVSATGCGDVLMAVLADALLKRMDLVAALKTAAPYASANAASPGIADMDLSALPDLAPDALYSYELPDTSI